MNKYELIIAAFSLYVVVLVTTKMDVRDYDCRPHPWFTVGIILLLYGEWIIGAALITGGLWLAAARSSYL